MDILHLNKNDIRELEINEYIMAIEYCWNAYTHRRVDYWITKAFSSDSGNTGNTTDWTPINPVSQALSKDRTIPEKFLKVINNS